MLERIYEPSPEHQLKALALLLGLHLDAPRQSTPLAAKDVSKAGAPAPAFERKAGAA
jgi:hypothetical protein